MSNRFNKLTQELVRPKVCKPPPPPVLKCEIQFPTITVKVFLGGTMLARIRDNIYPLSEPVAVTCEPGTHWAVMSTINNDFVWGVIAGPAFGPLGVFDVKVVFKIRGEEVCFEPLVVTVIPFF